MISEQYCHHHQAFIIMTIINNTYQATVTASHHSKCSYTHQVGYLSLHGHISAVDTTMDISTMQIRKPRPREALEDSFVSAGDCRRLASSNWHCSPPSFCIGIVSTAHCPKLDPDLDGYDVMYYLGIICLHLLCTFSYCINYIFCIYYTVLIHNIYFIFV